MASADDWAVALRVVSLLRPGGSLTSIFYIGIAAGIRVELKGITISKWLIGSGDQYLSQFGYGLNAKRYWTSKHPSSYVYDVFAVWRAILGALGAGQTVNGKGPSNNIAYSPNMRRAKVSNANSSEIDGNKGNIPWAIFAVLGQLCYALRIAWGLWGIDTM